MSRLARFVAPALALAFILPLSNLHAVEPTTQPTGTISGKVMKEDGTPAAAGVDVRVIAAPAAKKGKAQEKGQKREAIATGSTDANGAFTITVAPGTYFVQAGTAKKDKATGRERVTVKEGETVNVNITMKASVGKAK